MKATVSLILRVIAVICIVSGIGLLFVTQPIKSSSYEQRELYASNTYQNLAKVGVATKAVVSKVMAEPRNANATRILVKYFDKYGFRKQTEIAFVKGSYQERQLINILYDPSQTNIARVDPADETSLNWSAFGWLVALGTVLYWMGHHRHKVSGGIE